MDIGVIKAVVVVMVMVVGVVKFTAVVVVMLVGVLKFTAGVVVTVTVRIDVIIRLVGGGDAGGESEGVVDGFALILK